MLRQGEDVNTLTCKMLMRGPESPKLTGLLAKTWQGHREVAPGSTEGRRGQRSHRLRGAAWEGRGQTSLLLEDRSGWGGRWGRRSMANVTPTALLLCRERLEGDGARGGEDSGRLPWQSLRPVQKVEGLIPGPGTKIPRAVWHGWENG